MFTSKTHMNKKLVERSEYLEKLEMFRDDTNFIKVIMGVRRCGKSTLLDQYMERLKGLGVREDEILRMNLESAEFDHIEDYRDLKEYIYPRVPKNGRFYIFLDEIQRVKEWEKIANALMVDTEADIYITGSNSQLLSTELSTYLTGRYISIRMLPLSFKEYRELRGNGRNDNEVFEDYMKYGGFPAINPAGGETSVVSMLQDLYNSVVYQDVVSRGNIRNTGELERLVKYMMFNIGNPTSLRNISEESSINRSTVERYLDLLEEACIVYKANRFDLKSTALNPTPKYYAVDTGLRNISIGFPSADKGRVLENIVYLELLRRGYRVTVGKWDSKEVDFVVDKLTVGREYFQVCYNVYQEETQNRELTPLKLIQDNFPKTILTMNAGKPSVTKDGILVKDVMRWLLNEDE